MIKNIMFPISICLLMTIEKKSICQIKVPWFSLKFQIFICFTIEMNFQSSLALFPGQSSKQKPYTLDAQWKNTSWYGGPMVELRPG